ncbi:hypothetical protein RRG08_054434 [Elysia crispata]|uniref:Uncharacterized protein n=1 Tax=Elysia crispata TaxID=231223 RepID=A0AAE1AVK0_9GAST|nr:hypothetical protein RRG08_054434 [Elysia crispata]
MTRRCGRHVIVEVYPVTLETSKPVKNLPQLGFKTAGDDSTSHGLTASVLISSLIFCSISPLELSPSKTSAPFSHRPKQLTDKTCQHKSFYKILDFLDERANLSRKCGRTSGLCDTIRTNRKDSSSISHHTASSSDQHRRQTSQIYNLNSLANMILGPQINTSPAGSGRHNTYSFPCLRHSARIELPAICPPGFNKSRLKLRTIIFPSAGPSARLKTRPGHGDLVLPGPGGWCSITIKSERDKLT